MKVITNIDIALIITYSLQCLMTAYFFFYTLTPKYCLEKSLFSAFIPLDICMIFTYITSCNLFVKQFLFLVLYFFICRVLYRDSWKMITFSVTVLIIILALNDYMIIFLFYKILFPEYTILLQGKLLLLSNIAFNIIHFFTIYIFLFFWQRRKGNIFTKSIYLTLLFPVSQSFLLLTVVYYAILQIVNGISYKPAVVCILTGSIFSIIADIIMFQIISSNSQCQHLAVQLDMINRLAYRELAYYRSVNEKLIQMKEICFDFHNRLQTAYTIFLKNADKNDKNALDLLVCLENHVNQEMPPIYYCQNVIVNVILEEKAKKMKEIGISFYSDVTLPENLPIAMVDLCSIFSNLLDNAIESCRAQGDIRVLCYLRSGYCIVNVTNSFAENMTPLKPSKDPEWHGYGLLILNSIAEKYHGEFLTAIDNGYFTANMKLKINNMPQYPN